MAVTFQALLGSQDSDAFGEKLVELSCGCTVGNDFTIVPVTSEATVWVLTLKPSNARQLSSRPPSVSFRFGWIFQASCSQSAPVLVSPTPVE